MAERGSTGLVVVRGGTTMGRTGDSRGRRATAVLALTFAVVVFGWTSDRDAASAATPRRYVQKRVFRVTSGNSVSVSFRRPNTSGNLIVAYVVWDNAGSGSISDSAGNAYVSAAGPTQPTGDPLHAQLFYAGNVADGTNTITATFSTPIAARGVLYALEYSDVDSAAPLDAAVAASGSSSE